MKLLGIQKLPTSYIDFSVHEATVGEFCIFSPCPTTVVVGKWNAREMESLKYFLWVFPVCQLCDKAPGQMPKLKIVKNLFERLWLSGNRQDIL